MTYQLPPDIDQRVQSQIALGIYQTPDEVLNDALEQRHKLAESASVELASRGINKTPGRRVYARD